MEQDVLIAYVACASLEEARRIGRALVAERLAACVHLRPHHAIYRWDGAVEEAEETGLLAKTTRGRWDALAARVQALHSYDLPGILALPVTDGTEAFLGWVRDEVSPLPAVGPAPAP